ncbi:WD repeat-containing and planar cell polarity effector protein fritz isoform X2 [Nilaparvata lugens]|uniref:WD repeat-containing and planar cell polarity effector protein fritz isoform X2 n=1 Tax=Nilaparvata lugens TaxID=108931 RepID=UPI00193DC1EF|nr:WD repeat-containing and planar cell polarity effector protein fritz isoform X2 [Nilaparvata lugens]
MEVRKWSQLDAKHHIVELAGPSGRRLERKLSINTAGDMVLIWWRCTRDEVYPWSPVVKDQDRANVHVYSLRGAKAELLCYYRTEFDPVCVVFSQVQPNVINSVEQKISRKGEVTVERCTYEISKNRLQRSSVTSIALQTHVCCVAFSPDDCKLLLGCIDGSLVLFDDGQGSTHLVKAAFIPTLVCWHPDGALLLVANERCQIQCFDCALACVKIQLLGEDLMPSVLLDLSVYFRHQPTLLHVGWNKKSDALICSSTVAIQDGYLLLLFERGPLAVVKLIGGGGMLNDVHNQGLTSDALIAQYLNVGQADRAVNLLLSLNWDQAGYACLASLHRIVNHLLRLPLTPDRELQLETALGSFHVPARPLSHSTEEEFADPVRDLTRRFFHHLLRYRIFDKAFRLAIDLNEHDLFMDVHHYARLTGDTAMADAALQKADQVSDCSSQSDSSDCDCDRSSCSCSTESSGSVGRSGVGGGGGSMTSSVPPPLPVVHRSLQPQLLNGNPRQKVKFSDTVTHITVQEELSGLSEEEERRINTVGLPPVYGCPALLPPYMPSFSRTAPQESTFHYQLFNTNTSAPISTPNTAKDYLSSATTALTSDRDEEESDTIKVVHFGIV